MPKILVVADNEQLGELLVERLKRRGHNVLRAEEARNAVSNAKASQPDVIILDSPLRGDGDWSTARALKSDAITRESPIIGLLANSSEDAQAEALKNGCDEIRSKPLDFHQLLGQIATLAKEEEPEAAEEMPS